MAEYPSRPRGLPTSAITREGIDEFVTQLSARLVKSPTPPSTAVPFLSRQIDAIRNARRSALAGDQATAAERLAMLILHQS
jgi:hypothetical protein